MATWRLGLLSDLHLLHKFGLVPPRWRLRGARRVDPTYAVQNYMWRIWREFCAWFPPCEVSIVNGDAIHGEDFKDGGRWVTSPDPDDQATALVETLEPIRSKLGRLFVLRGSPYHEGKSSEAIEAAARALRAEQYWGPKHTGYVLDLDWHGLRINASHYMTRGFLYRGTAGDRTSMLHNIAEHLAKVNPADVIVRAHLHMKYISKSHGKWVFLQPGWTCLNPHAIRTMEWSRGSVMSDIGAAVLETDASGGVKWLEFDRPPYRQKVVRVD